MELIEKILYYRPGQVVVCLIEVFFELSMVFICAFYLPAKYDDGLGVPRKDFSFGGENITYTMVYKKMYPGVR